ncbi:hypothetical protein FM113_00480 [Leucobacter sp. 7(1)]|uniref:hypothetical protein n=1 Tax=Leucobacter sp. 7(1) TaxID=1255613 RepID=UPI00097EA7B6|nr:hypothetical protein [Leucobacter sp. 7(1)]SJN08020.1 hypothetical protein FM113_00480 [Leucobacter sp. 7(1)]
MTTQPPSSHTPATPLATVLALVHDDAAAQRFDQWGLSTLIDEHTGVASIGRDVFDALHTAAGIEAVFPIGNAGLIHVYGYWFSDVPTPFGLKRDRWADGELAAAFGLPRHAFHLTKQGATTPLQRVAAAMRRALDDPPHGTRVADVDIPTIGSAGSGTPPEVSLRRSRVVLQRPHSRLPWALSYAIAAPDAPATAPLQLLTAFPVHGDPAPLLADFLARPAPRWNAVSNS